MKKLFKNFSWLAFVSYAIPFLIISIPVRWVAGSFNEPNNTLLKIAVGLLFESVMFGLLMSLFFGKK